MKRWCSRYSAGTESYRELVEAGGADDEGTHYVLASDHDRIVAEKDARIANAERLLEAVNELSHTADWINWHAARYAWLASLPAEQKESGGEGKKP